MISWSASDVRGATQVTMAQQTREGGCRSRGVGFSIPLRIGRYFLRLDWRSGPPVLLNRIISLNGTQRLNEEFGKLVEIGSGGGGAIILPGVRIGHRAVIGAGSVVTKDIPEGMFAAGNPCRVIREIIE